jgi:hypothetical protein
MIISTIRRRIMKDIRSVSAAAWSIGTGLALLDGVRLSKTERGRRGHADQGAKSHNENNQASHDYSTGIYYLIIMIFVIINY